MLNELLPECFFGLADNVLNFAGILFCSSIGFQIGVIGYLADCLLDCSLDFVELACRHIFSAWLHFDLLLCNYPMIG